MYSLISTKQKNIRSFLNSILLSNLKNNFKHFRKFLLDNGMNRRKVGSIPAKADIEKQKKFIDEQMEPRLQEARENKRAVYFVDAAHFVLAPFLGFLWCFTRIFIKAAPGRQRFNVLGALNVITHKLITVTTAVVHFDNQLQQALCLQLTCRVLHQSNPIMNPVHLCLQQLL